MSTNAVTQSGRIKLYLDERAVKESFARVLGERAPGFISSIISVTAGNRDLAAADPASICSAAMVAATIDLPIIPSIGYAHIVPYKHKGVALAQFQMGWKGFVQLAHRTGKYRRMKPSVIYEGQLIEENEFTGEMVFQKERKSDTVIGYNFYFLLLTAFEHHTYMKRENAEKHARKYSKALQAGFGPWKDDFDSMAMKTVVKSGLSKWGPLSLEMHHAIQHDQAVYEGEKPSFLDVPEEPQAPPSSRLHQAILGNEKTPTIMSPEEKAAEEVDAKGETK